MIVGMAFKIWFNDGSTTSAHLSRDDRSTLPGPCKHGRLALRVKPKPGQTWIRALKSVLGVFSVTQVRELGSSDWDTALHGDAFQEG